MRAQFPNRTERGWHNSARDVQHCVWRVLAPAVPGLAVEVDQTLRSLPEHLLLRLRRTHLRVHAQEGSRDATDVGARGARPARAPVLTVPGHPSGSDVAPRCEDVNALPVVGEGRPLVTRLPGDPADRRRTHSHGQRRGSRARPGAGVTEVRVLAAVPRRDRHEDTGLHYVVRSVVHQHVRTSRPQRAAQHTGPSASRSLLKHVVEASQDTEQRTRTVVAHHLHSDHIRSLRDTVTRTRSDRRAVRPVTVPVAARAALLAVPEETGAVRTALAPPRELLVVAVAPSVSHEDVHTGAPLLVVRKASANRSGAGHRRPCLPPRDRLTLSVRAATALRRVLLRLVHQVHPDVVPNRLNRLVCQHPFETGRVEPCGETLHHPLEPVHTSVRGHSPCVLRLARVLPQNHDVLTGDDLSLRRRHHASTRRRSDGQQQSSSTHHRTPVFPCNRVSGFPKRSKKYRN
eukprot:Hpha_TRINITY_DN15008_c2_g19::TRINITY_DN15008_c2_g19_i2::g.123979::m.123979